MKAFLIITNITKDPELELTGHIEKYLRNKGATSKIVIRKVGNTQEDKLNLDLGERIDYILVLGGDGTLLKAARDTAGKDIPILGVNLGTLGFLAEVEKNHIDDALDRLISGEFQTQKRMMLCGRIIHGEEIKNISPALNDITITRCGSLQIIRFRIYVNQQFLCKLSADGMIVATPTGSTGYNMSAGGPIVEPGADLIVLTPICAHTLNARSIVLKADDEIAIVIEQGRDRTSLMVEANSDGNEKITMVTGDKILINKSINTTTIIKLNQVSFLETLHKKMSDE